MKECRLNSQNDLINLVVQSLKDTSLGQGFVIMYDIEYLKQNDSTTMVFKRKDGKDINASDFFFLGYFVGRDFEEKICKECEGKRNKALENLYLKKNK